MTNRTTAAVLAAALAVAAISVDVYHDMTKPHHTTAVVVHMNDVHADAATEKPNVYHDM